MAHLILIKYCHHELVEFDHGHGTFWFDFLLLQINSTLKSLE